MERDLQEPLRRLAAALHRAIEQSPEVGLAMAAIRDEGFRSYLLLEVTVALSRADEPADPPDDELQMGFAETSGDEGWIVELEGGAPAEPPESLKSRIAPGDREFFESIRIRLD